MGFFHKLNQASQLSAVATEYSTASNLLSPNSSAHLAAVLFPDVDTSLYPVTLADAIQVPAVARAVQLYSVVSHDFDLEASTGDLPFLTETEGAITPSLRTVFTVQDLIFHNESLWICSRDEAGYVDNAMHLSRERWTYDAQGVIKVDGLPVNQSDVIYFRGVMPEGFLSAGRNSVRHALNIASTINNRSAVPEPVTIIKQTTAEDVAEDEIDEVLENLADALKSKRGGSIFVPFELDVTGYGASDSNNTMLLGARMAVRTDLANHLGISADMLDGSTGSNEVYSNALQSQSELLNLSIKTFTQPIAARLSQNDITPKGTKVTFNYDSFDSTVDAKGNIGTSTPSPIQEVVPND
jgi:hypothetical protein